MKNSFIARTVSLAALTALVQTATPLSLLAQNQPPPGVIQIGPRAAAATQPELPRFDLDFPGGTPQQLLDAIAKSLGSPVNAIIPSQYADTKLPALKLQRITVPGLFEALSAACEGQTVVERYPDGSFTRETGVAVGFTAPGRSQSSETNQVWYFYRRRGVNHTEYFMPAVQSRTVRFFQLGPYLDKYKVEDITTAVRSAWELLGDTNQAQMKFHKETKMLIAVGETNQLNTIQAVLRELDPTPAAPKPMGMNAEMMKRYGLTPPPAAPQKAAPKPAPESQPEPQ